MENVKGLLTKAAGMLKECRHTSTPILDAELILVHVMNQAGMNFNRLKLVTQSEQLVNEQIAGKYLQLIDERSKGKPVQYITNRQEFMGLEMYVAEGVLIPRGDTEILVGKVIELLGNIKDNINIIDMCTGSGAIAVSLAMSIPSARLWAVDISGSALDCCGINVRRYGLENRINIVRSDLFGAMGGRPLSGNTDVIISNPPYIESSVIGELGVNVRDYEPHLALDGGKDGLVYYRRIVQESAGFIKKNGILAFEIGHDQGVKVKNIMEESGRYGCINIESDLAGYDRCIWGRRL